MRLRYAQDLFPEIDTIVERQRASYPEILDETFWDAFFEASPYSLVPIPGFYNTYRTLHYIAQNDIPGAFVECGCFLGGMAIFTARVRELVDLSARPIILFDTFQGFPDRYLETRFSEGPVPHEHFLESVKENFVETIGHTRGVQFIEGPAEETVPRFDPIAISLLRLDTDYYSSTRVELEHLYPMLSPGGGLVIDDYGVMEGARHAVDEYFAPPRRAPLLNRLNVGIWAGVKP